MCGHTWLVCLVQMNTCTIFTEAFLNSPFRSTCVFLFALITRHCINATFFQRFHFVFHWTQWICFFFHSFKQFPSDAKWVFVFLIYLLCSEQNEMIHAKYTGYEKKYTSQMKRTVPIWINMNFCACDDDVRITYLVVITDDEWQQHSKCIQISIELLIKI